MIMVIILAVLAMIVVKALTHSPVSYTHLPLAGSARRQPDEVLDREAGNRLLASEKDRHEQDRKSVV